MSMVARPRVNDATDDTTDIDDGEARISTDAFWPDMAATCPFFLTVRQMK